MCEDICGVAGDSYFKVFQKTPCVELRSDRKAEPWTIS